MFRARKGHGGADAFRRCAVAGSAGCPAVGRALMLRADPKAMRDGAQTVPEAADDPAALRAALAATRAELSESNRRFDQFVANLSGVAYRCQLEAPWQMSFISSGVEALTGYPSSALEAAKAWAEIMYPADLPQVEAEVAAGVAEGRSFSLCYRIVHASGELRWVREKGRAVHAEDGRPLFLEGVIEDAGAEKRLELSLRNAEAEASRRAEALHTLLDSVPQMIWSYDPGRGRRRYSRQWEAFTGCDLNAPGAPGRMDFVHPDDRPAAEARWQHSLATGQTYEAQYRIRNRDGDYRWLLSRGHASLFPDGSVRAWYGSCTDIHERVLAEAAVDDSERLARGIVEASPDCISVLDLDGRRLFANAATMRAYEVGDGTDLDGELWGVRFPEPARSRAAEALVQAQAGEVARLLIQYGPDERWWDIILAPVRDDQGRPTRIIVLSRDISDQKKAEERASWAANHDALTGLPNRFLFQKTLDEAIACSLVATWTTSSASTTRSATTPAIRSSAPSPRASAAPCAARTWSRAWAATSLRCSSPALTTKRASRPRSRRSSKPCASPASTAAASSIARRASARACSRCRASTAPNCSRMPMSRSTPPRPPAAPI
jgi:PAS domain S-box-containing protein